MNLLRVIWLTAIIATAAAAPATAQSFLESLFGLGSKPADLPPPMPSYRAPLHVPQRSSDDARRNEPARSSSLQVRTMCVRMCDGYYFPLSNKISVRNLSAESARCKASCSSDARLYYTASKDPEPASMVDLTGRRYDAMEKAYTYRKALVPGCTCKPAPWSSVARQRHANYALEKSRIETAATDSVETQTPASEAEPDSGNQDQDTGQQETNLASIVPSASENAAQARPRIANQQPERRSQQLRRQQKRSVTRASKPRPRRYSRAVPEPSFGNFFGLGGKSQVWPGDAR